MQKPRFIKNDEGLYRVRGYVSPDEGIADDVLLENLVAQESLTSPEEAARFLQLALAQEKNEHFGVLFAQQCLAQASVVSILFAMSGEQT